MLLRPVCVPQSHEHSNEGSRKPVRKPSDSGHGRATPEDTLTSQRQALWRETPYLLGIAGHCLGLMRKEAFQKCLQGSSIDVCEAAHERKTRFKCFCGGIPS